MKTIIAACTILAVTALATPMAQAHARRGHYARYSSGDNYASRYYAAPYYHRHHSHFGGRYFSIGSPYGYKYGGPGYGYRPYYYNPYCY